MIIVGILGTVFYYTFIISFFIIMTPIAFLAWLISAPFDRQRRISHWINCYVGKAILFFNPFWRVRIHGMENIDKNGTYIFTPNHQSLIDIPILSSTALQFKWISKKELTYLPLLGWIMAYAKYVLLSRKDPRSQIKMMRSCENYLNNNMSIGIFPEGTRSGKEELGKFRDGASLLAKKTGTKILPICMSGNWKSMPHKLIFWTKRVDMNMYFLDPIDPGSFDKTKEISVAIREAIANKQREITT